jgi:3-hydroxyisobutyrate dehydrogenase
MGSYESSLPTKEKHLMATIAWIGLGHMGIPMSSNMLKAGYTVRGFDIDLLALRRAKAAGIQTVKSIREAVSGAVAVFTMLPAGPDVDQVLTSHDGVFANAAPDTIIIDCSTVGIDYAKKIHDAARQVNVAFVEAPVSGGTEGAAAGNLTFMLGGDHRYIDRAKELLGPMGEFMSHVGGAGAGQAAKVVNNLIMGVSVTINSEATFLAQRLGLDLKNLYDIVLHSSGDNWSFRKWNPAPGVVPESPASHGYVAGFKTWLLAKDLHLAIEAGESVGVRLATAEAAHGLLRKHADTGGADLDCSSLILGLGKSAHLGELTGATRSAK